MDDRKNVTIICMIPVKNEAWILERCLSCASLWADHIIVADQGSMDGSVEIAGRYPKVILLENRSREYNEPDRQKLLLDAARSLPTKANRILIALDADEMLSASCLNSSEWDRIIDASPGTLLYFNWVSILPGFERCWLPKQTWAFGYVDDGKDHGGSIIHSSRIPALQDSPSLTLSEIQVLHYQYLAWDRMKSKQRWYQCWERLHFPKKRAVQIYRQYHGMDARPPTEVVEFCSELVAAYESRGIDMRSINAKEIGWWDADIVRMLEKHGTRKFSKIDIWDVDWNRIRGSRWDGLPPASIKNIDDPRSAFERYVHNWLWQTQSRAGGFSVRWLQRALRLVGW